MLGRFRSKNQSRWWKERLCLKPPFGPRPFTLKEISGIAGTATNIQLVRPVRRWLVYTEGISKGQFSFCLRIPTSSCKTSLQLWISRLRIRFVFFEKLASLFSVSKFEENKQSRNIPTTLLQNHPHINYEQLNQEHLQISIRSICLERWKHPRQTPIRRTRSSMPK